MMKTYTLLVLLGCTIGVSLNAQTTKASKTTKASQTEKTSQTEKAAKAAKASQTTKALKSSTTLTKDTLIQRDLIMEKEYKPVVETAEKIFNLPELDKQNMTKKPMEFSISESPTALQGEYTPLPPAGIRASFPASNQRGFIRLGVGSRRSFLGDAQLNLLRKSKQSLDLNVQHRSIFGDMTLSTKETQRVYSNNNRIIASYKLHLNLSEIDANISEKYNVWNNYGTWRTGSMGSNALNVPGSQWSSDAKYGFGLKSKNLGQAFSYVINIEGHSFRLGKGITSATDVPTDPKGGLEKEFNTRAALNYDVSKILHFGVDGQIRTFQYRSPASWPVDQLTPYSNTEIDKSFQERSWFELNPYAKMTYKKWMLSAGVKLSVPTLESERVKGNLTASAATPLGQKAIFRATLDGGVQPLSYREGIEMNPYLDPAIRLKSNWKPIAVSASIEFRPTQSLCLTPIFSYDITKDMPFFYNEFLITSSIFNEGVNRAYGKVFSVKYMNSNKLRVGLNSLYSVHGVFTFLGELSYNKYLNYSENNAIDALLKANGRKAWNKPGVEMRLRADFTPIEDFSFFADYKMEALRYTADQSAFCSQMKDIYDLNIGANYKLTKDVSIFFHVNNLLDQRYEVWNAYQVHGFTALMGGSVTF
jgi:hypothetical protein